jgi:hypothetical protein
MAKDILSQKTAYKLKEDWTITSRQVENCGRVGNRLAIDGHSFRYAFVQREKMVIFLSADYAD